MEANWDLFRLFFVVARTGSVNRAARELGMSQPTLSRRLKELERYVGAPLFFRASSGVRLTQEGEDLQHSANEMMAAIETFQRDLRTRVGRRSAVVRISASEGMTKHWVLPRVKRLQQINNRLVLEIVSTIYQQSLATSDLDFVIRIGDPGDKDLIGKRVATLAFGVFASEDYLAEHSVPRTLADLKSHQVIGQTSDFGGFASERAGQMQLVTEFAAAAESSSVLRVVPISNHFAAAALGLGLALLPVPFAMAEGLVRVLPQETSSISVWLLRRRESDLRKATREVRRFLEREFADSASWLHGQQRTARPVRRRG